jgi:hypothetical protein
VVVVVVVVVVNVDVLVVVGAVWPFSVVIPTNQNLKSVVVVVVEAVVVTSSCCTGAVSGSSVVVAQSSVAKALRLSITGCHLVPNCDFPHVAKMTSARAWNLPRNSTVSRIPK